MFEVARIRHYIFFKRVDFRALDAMVGTKDGVAWSPHSTTVVKWEYRFDKGSITSLSYPFWRSFRVAQQVELARILLHPFVPLERMQSTTI